MTLKDLEVRIDQLVDQAKRMLANARQDPHMGSWRLVPEEWTQVRAAGLSFIESTFGRDHPYYSEFSKKFGSGFQSDGQLAMGILTAVRDQIKGGWIETTKGLVTGEVFADFMEMAEHLLDEKYKDAAAVIVGSTLEEHVRQLCKAVGVPTDDPSSGKARKAETLNAELTKSGKYALLDQKSITAWLDLRNKAAHGKYSEYNHDQVRLMLDGVRNFISRVRP